jgi:hypothetical protein
MEGPTASWGLRNRKHTKPFINMNMMMKSQWERPMKMTVLGVENERELLYKELTYHL